MRHLSVKVDHQADISGISSPIYRGDVVTEGILSVQMIYKYIMFWNSFIRYGCKNFKHHMNITNNITLKGLLRRYQRKYPTFFRGMKLTFIISGLYVIGLSMIPGTTLPLQQQIKISCFGM